MCWLQAASPNKDSTAKSPRRVARGSGSSAPAPLRRCASLAESRRIPDEKRRLLRASSTESLVGQSAGSKTKPLGGPTTGPLPAAAANSPTKAQIVAGHGKEASTATAATGAPLSPAAGLLGAMRRKKQAESQPSDDPHGDVSDSEAGDARASLQVDSELINAAYKEIEKCMECFNVLGLRFQRSSMLPLKQTTSSRWANGICGSQTSEEMEMARSRRGASRTRAHAPFRPFLRKDRNVAKKGALPVKSTYTKLHKVKGAVCLSRIPQVPAPHSLQVE